MGCPEKKISFSFSKVKKRPRISNTLESDPGKSIEYVDSFDGSKGTFSFRGCVRKEETAKKDLVIPLIISESSNDLKKKLSDKHKSKSLNSLNVSATKSSSHISDKSDSEKCLDKMAAHELLKDINNGNKEKGNSENIIIKHSHLVIDESSPIDYDQVPVEEFGMAMLRGMGWNPNSGIGKNPKLLVPVVPPKLKPGGPKLGAGPGGDGGEGTVEHSKDCDHTHI